MRRGLVYVAAGLAGVLLVLVACQLLVSAYLEHRAENRLTENGGDVSVSIEALPVARLLFDRGKRIEVRGGGIDVPLEGERGRVFDDLDRFEEADVRLDRLKAGPLRINRFSLTRGERDEPYALAVSASVTASALSNYAGRQVGGPVVGLLARIAAATLPFSSEPIPVEVDAAIVSEKGEPHLTDVDGTVAGLPAGPLASALAAAIAGRL
ncbi:MAG TPA: hypothetical protein VF520_03940 [Thermoleophilaceae bacterium]|jgi:hypothetical protein